jgi:hypothetical protein
MVAHFLIYIEQFLLSHVVPAALVVTQSVEGWQLRLSCQSYQLLCYFLGRFG